MASGVADLHKAVNDIWNSSSLGPKFSVYWQDGQDELFSSLHDQEAEPTQPFPYCVFTQEEGRVITRMNDYETREVPWTFKIEARDMGGAESAKEIAAKLAEEVMKVFGGHPSSKSVCQGYPLNYGRILLAQFQFDSGMRAPTRENWNWVIKYNFILDVPVAG